jgi:hypothetical protein
MVSAAHADTLYVNGIDGTTGRYLVEPLSLPRLMQVLRDRQVPDPARSPERVAYLKIAASRLRQPHFGLPLDRRPEAVNEAGWAIVFHDDEAPAVRKAMEPLIERRRRQIGDDTICKVLDYHEGEGWSEWLARHGVAAGSVEPDRVPFYLLLVGSPARIPFAFSQQLDIEYSVGRLHFDLADEYERYAKSVIEYETSKSVPTAREAVFFAPRHDFDTATQMSADLLVQPLARGVPSEANHPAVPGVAEKRGFRTTAMIAEVATTHSLAGVFERSPGEVPSFLFTASHGMGWPAGNPEQLEGQGALLCQDWPGFGNVKPDHYFAGANVSRGARVHGLVAFFFACYGAGTPSHDRFLHEPGQSPSRIANAPFIAALPKRLLSHPQGGALACIGHVERAWGYSIAPPAVGPQLLPFQNAIGRILIGQPIGYALKDFNEKFATLSADLSSTLERVGFGQRIPEYELATLWINRNDAEGYITLGDPAAQLRADSR